MDELWNLYTSKVKKFENVDDAYNDKAANVKSKYTNLFEGVWDVVEWGSEIVWGLVKGLAVGLYEIAKGLLTLVLDTGIVVLSDTIPDRIEPEGLKQIANDRVETYKQTMQQIISDPMSVVENIGQTVFDAAEDEGIMYVTGVGLTTFVPVVGQVGKGAKGVSTLKAISKGSNKNVPTEVFKGTPYSKDFIKQKVTTTKTALGKQKVPVFYKEKLATDSVNITTFGMEMKPLSEVNPQMFSVKGAKGTGKYQVGAYKDIKGVKGLDAHHAGQKAAMKKLVDNYDLNTAPAINVPKVGHTIKGPNGIVSRSTKGIDNPRQLLARDIRELRRVYDDIPNSALKELIELNKKMYPEMRK